MSPVSQALIVNLLVWAGVFLLLLLLRGGAGRLEENAKGKILPGLVLLAALGSFAAAFHRENAVPYADFAAARRARTPVKVYGEPVKHSIRRDAAAHVLRFRVKDENDAGMSVAYAPPRPARLEHAAGIMMTGIYKDKVFHAKELNARPMREALIVNLIAWAGIFLFFLALESRVRRIEKS